MSDDAKFTDLFNPNKPRSTKEVIEDRLAICQTCPQLNQKLMQCRKCGCFMKLKTTLQGAKCPLGKW